MTPETQQRILALFSSFADNVSESFELEAFSYEKGVEALRTYGNKTGFELLLNSVKAAVPSIAQFGTLTRDHFPQVISAFSTQEQAEALLAQIPEPEGDRLEIIIQEVSSLLPRLRKILELATKRLPHDPGGRPKKFSTLSQKQDLRREIGDLYAKGLTMPQAKLRVAKRHKCGLSTIYRALRELEDEVPLEE